MSKSRGDAARVGEIVAVFDRHKPQISLFRDQLVLALSSSKELTPYVHSFRSRIKDNAHLEDKLRRKVASCRREGKDFDIDKDNCLVKVNDLVGVRILHLHTRQIQHIDKALQNIFKESQYNLLEGPFARTWDDESRDFFRGCNIETQDSPSLYTSVHYVIESASRTKLTAELQVRTLMEEVWSEVDHSMNYPKKTASVACGEQLKVLARVTSSATRLVDSIFASLDDHSRSTRNLEPKRPRKRPG